MPLNVLPSMTNPPVAGFNAPRWMLDSLPVRRPEPHSTAEHDQVEGVHRLDLQPARAAPARLVRRGQRLRHHPFVAGVECRVEEPLRGVGVVGDQPIHPMGLSARSRPARRPARWSAGRAGRRRRDAAGRRRTPTAAATRGLSRCRRCGRTATRSPGIGAGVRRGAGRSPRRRRSGRVTGSASVASTTSGSRAVTSSRLRV